MVIENEITLGIIKNDHHERIRQIINDDITMKQKIQDGQNEVLIPRTFTMMIKLRHQLYLSRARRNLSNYFQMV